MVVAVSLLLVVGYSLYPEIDVQRPQGTSIVDGGTDDVGTQPLGTLDLTYTIENVAASATTSLTVQTAGVTASGLVNCSGFTVMTPLPLEIAIGDTADVEVSLTVDGDGPFSLDMDIANDDQNENPYDIHLVGTGDGDPPGVVSVTPTSLADADADAGPVTVEITFDEAMDTGTNPSPTITGLATDPYTITGSAWSNGDTTWTGTFTFVDNGEEATGTYNISGFVDAFGNTMVADSTHTVDVDTKDPTVQGLQPGDYCANKVLFTYDQDMVDAAASASNYTISGAGRGTLADHPDTVSSVSADQVLLTWNSGEMLNGDWFGLTVDSVHDLAGNVIVPPGTTGNNAEDRSCGTPPKVVSITVSEDPMYDGALKQRVMVEFDEPMMTDGTADPVFTFGSGTFTTTIDDGAWTGSTRFGRDYWLTDEDETIAGVTVGVTGAKDAAGNPQADHAPQPVFDIDTENPYLIGLNGTSHCDRRIYAVFSETMADADASPLNYTISGDGRGSLADHPDSVVLDSGVWYLLTWNAGEQLDGVWYWIAGANMHDLAGNVFDQGSESPAGDAGCAVPPNIVSVAVDTDPISDADLTQQVTVTFDEAMKADGTADPAITFGDGTFASAGDGAWSVGDTVWTETYVLDDSDETSTGVTVDVTGAKDAAGNPQNDYTPQPEFDIDTENPWISSITSTTPNGCYDVGAAVDITMIFSEAVTLTGASPRLKVDLDSGASDVLLAVPSGATSTNGTYTVGGGENSCDLNVTGIEVLGSMQDAAGNDLDPDKTMDMMATGNLANNKDITVDTTDPTIGAIDLTTGDDRLDANCGKTVNYEVTIADNCCIDLDASSIAVTPSATSATTSGLTMNLTPSTGKVTSVVVSGTFVVSVIDACSSIPALQVDVVDCTGHTDTRTDVGPTVSDGTAPTFSGFAVTPADGRVDVSCTEVVAFSVNVHDNCSVDLDDPTAVVVTESATNASTSGLAWSVDKAGLQSDFTITGSFTAGSLTGCPAIPTVEVQVTDLCGNVRTASQDGADIEDDIVPVIHDLRVDRHVMVEECCEAVVTFDGYVTDNCCVHPDGIAITVTVPTSNATVEFSQANDVQFTQCLPDRVDFSGEIHVRCLVGCPAIVQVTVNADDCCGNSAVPVASKASGTDPNETGHVFDETVPIPRDDPRQDVVMDGSAIIDPLVEVRRDEFGAYRLVLRENTPVRIDVLANDADNCSCEDCDHPFGPCGGCASCAGCCGTMLVYEIVTPPAYGTATIEGAAGDCSGGSAIRFAPDRGYVGPDELTYRTRDACGNVSGVASTVYLQTVPEVAMEDVFVTACAGESVEFAVIAADLWVDADPEAIPFGFSVVGGPSHGVLIGDPTDVTLAPESRIVLGGVTVPTLDFTETASITLMYTPKAGYTGRDAVLIRFADPFGNETTARVDIAVGTCIEAGRSEIEASRGEILRIIAPEGSILSAISVLLVDLADGLEHPDALSIAFDGAIDRPVLTVDTGAVSPGEYVLSIPLGEGEGVDLTLLVTATGHP